MTYSEIISVLTKEVRESRAWPSGGAGSAVTEQLRIVFGAVLVLGRDLSVSLLKESFKAEELAKPAGVTDDIFELPADLFFTRPDLGIAHLIIDGKRILPGESLSFLAFRTGKDNPWQTGNILIHIDAAEGMVYVAGACDTVPSAVYAPIFTVPTVDNYSDLDVPLPIGYQDQVTQLAAMHVEAILTGNRSKSAVHRALSEFYGERAQPVAAES